MYPRAKQAAMRGALPKAGTPADRKRKQRPRVPGDLGPLISRPGSHFIYSSANIGRSPRRKEEGIVGGPDVRLTIDDPAFDLCHGNVLLGVCTSVQLGVWVFQLTT